MENQRDEGKYEDDMDQRASDVKAETDRPKKNENNSNDCEHKEFVSV